MSVLNLPGCACTVFIYDGTVTVKKGLRTGIRSTILSHFLLSCVQCVTVSLFCVGSLGSPRNMYDFSLPLVFSKSLFAAVLIYSYVLVNHGEPVQ